jgi:hypothetical protein
VNLFEDEPFIVFRSALFAALTIYYTVMVLATGLMMLRWLRGEDPYRRLLRTYVSYSMCSIRLRPLAGELLEIAFWTTILVVIWWLHQVI